MDVLPNLFLSTDPITEVDLDGHRAMCHVLALFLAKKT